MACLIYCLEGFFLAVLQNFCRPIDCKVLVTCRRLTTTYFPYILFVPACLRLHDHRIEVRMLQGSHLSKDWYCGESTPVLHSCPFWPYELAVHRLNEHLDRHCCRC